MNHPNDNYDVRDELDEETIESLLRGEAATPELRPLADAMTALRDGPHRPVHPSPELARRMALDLPAASGQPQPRTWLSTLSAFGLRTKVATVAATGLIGLTGLTAAGALPDAAQQRVEKIIEQVTRIDVSGRDSTGDSSVSDQREDGTNNSDSVEITNDEPGEQDDEAQRSDEKGANDGNGTDDDKAEPGQKEHDDKGTEQGHSERANDDQAIDQHDDVAPDPASEPTTQPTTSPTPDPTESAEPTEDEPTEDPTTSPTTEPTPDSTVSQDSAASGEINLEPTTGRYSARIGN